MIAAASAASAAACYLSFRAGQRHASRREERRSAPRDLAPAAGATYFLSGVMGGSGGGASTLAGLPVESQDYRSQLRLAISAADASAVCIDPAEIVKERAPELHPPGTNADKYWAADAAVAAMFGECVQLAGCCDVIVSYLPSASMGSAVELHAARKAGRIILVVAPNERMQANWVVRSYADAVFGDIAALQQWLVQKRPQPRAIKHDADADGPASLQGSITFIYSQSLVDSRRFYEQGLGLGVRSDKGAVIFYALPGGAASLGVVQQGVSAAATPPCSASCAGRDTVMICMLTHDVDGALAACCALQVPGVAVEQPAQENSRFGIYNALLRDPDGYLVELQRFTDGIEHRQFCGGAL